MKNTIFALIIIPLSCLTAFGVVEMAVRTFTPQMSGEVVYGYDENLGAIPLPYQRGVKTPPGEGPSYWFSHNSMGFRGTKEYDTKQEAYRVLFIGDSFTYGVGLNDDQTFPYLAENILQAKNYSVELINAGNPGVGTDYELKLIQVYGEKLRADLVVLCFDWSDFYDNAEGTHFRVGENGELTPKKPHSLCAKKARIESLPGIHWLLSWSQAANLVKNSTINFLRCLPKAAKKLKKTFAMLAVVSNSNPVTPPAPVKINQIKPPAEFRNNPGAPDEGKYLPENPPGYKELTKLYISQLIKTTRSQGSDILCCYLTQSPQVEYYRKNGQISPYERDFVEIVESLGEKPYSLTSPLTVVPERLDLPYWGHWSPAATREVTKFMAARIEEWLQTRKYAGAKGENLLSQGRTCPPGLPEERPRLFSDRR
jgi:hypothetical protein